MAASILTAGLRPNHLLFYEDHRKSTCLRHQRIHERQLYLPIPAAQTVSRYCDECCVINILCGCGGSSSLRLCGSCQGVSGGGSNHTDREDEEDISSPGIRPIFSGFQSCVFSTFCNVEFYADLCRGITDVQNWSVGSSSVRREVSLDTSTIMMDGKYKFHGQIISYLDTEVAEYNHRPIWPFGIQEKVNKPMAAFTSNTGEFVYLMQKFYMGAYTGPMIAQCSVSDNEGESINDVSIPFAPSEAYNSTNRDHDDDTVPAVLTTTESDHDPQTFTVSESLDCNEPHNNHIEPLINGIHSTEPSCNSDKKELDYCGLSSVAYDDGGLSTTVC